MERIHFLNVDEGTCILVQHASGRVSMIDICSGNLQEKVSEGTHAVEFVKDAALKGNFNYKDRLTNPITYLTALQIKEVFRFILTHPDMDHMDGLNRLFEELNVCNFWDTRNKKEKVSIFGAYHEEDWERYQYVRKGSECTVLHLEPNAVGVFYNRDEGDNQTEAGDGLKILAPSKELMDNANRIGNYNDSSYVILYTTTCGRRILFPGDSEVKEWDYLMNKFSKELSGIDILVAPHHGRVSGGNDKFLDIMSPKLTLFGNANSEHLNYNDWNNRRLEKITSNQAGNVLIEQCENGNLAIYVENSKLADDNHLFNTTSKRVGNKEYYLWKCI